MQSYYSNPHQLQAAVAAAAASGGGGGSGGSQRLPFQSPFAGLHDTSGRSPHMRGLHGAPESTGVICAGNTQHPLGSLDEINESGMESDILSEDDDDNDDDDKRLDSSTTTQSKLKRKEEGEGQEEEEGALKSSPQNLSSSSKRLRGENADDDGGGGGGDGGGGGSGPDDEQQQQQQQQQTEIKVQRPLGLLAQHGLSMKTTAATPATLKTQEFDHRHHHHHHNHHNHHLHHGGGGERWERERRGSPGPLQDAVDRGRQQQEDEEDDEGLLDMHRRDNKETGCGGLDFSGGQMSLMDRRFMPSPPSLASPAGLDSNKRPSTPSEHHWTFEEQFKQLYEMTPESKRKEFLDDLFTFMQKRGTPVNRIPIMAKQTLDLYELFRLVVSKGGLVEVINKKLWREITKGLNLPSSITSAAFTLRTQYMKYLYPYECDRLKLSTLSELQSAIDGNRREGRRPGYGYDFSPIPTLLPTPPTPHLNGPLHPLASSRPPTGLSPKDEDRCLLQQQQQSGHLRSLAEHDVRAMEVATRAMEDLVNKRLDEVSRAAAIASSVMTAPNGVMAAPIVHSTGGPVSKFDEMSSLKRPSTMFEEDRFLAHMGMHSTHIKINSRSNGRLEYDSSMVVSMEINGMMYQGVLFAQHPRRI